MKSLTVLLFLFTTSLFYSQEGNFVIKDKKATITLTLENNAKTIELHKESKFTISVENMDIKKSAVIGRGIRILYNEKAIQENYMQCTTTIEEQAVVDGHYKILFSYRENGESKTYTFLIPVRE